MLDLVVLYVSIYFVANKDIPISGSSIVREGL